MKARFSAHRIATNALAAASSLHLSAAFFASAEPPQLPPNCPEAQFDAWRTAVNWPVDWAWWAKDPRERELSDRPQAFFESKGLAAYGNQFTLGGSQLGADHPTGLVAMNAVASLAATHPRARQFGEALGNRSVPSGQWRYYDGRLYLLARLHCRGECRIGSPQSPGRSKRHHGKTED
jgi:oligosaccharide reducing-end xylanase